MNALIRLLGLALLVSASALVQAQPPALAFEQAWIRAAPPAAAVMAGYVRISNPGTHERVIESVTAVGFAAAHLHEMREVDGVMRMRGLDTLRVGAGQTVVLAPGGRHLMLMRPHPPLRPGERVEVEFVLDGGARQRVSFEVRADPPG